MTEEFLRHLAIQLVAQCPPAREEAEFCLRFALEEVLALMRPRKRSEMTEGCVLAFRPGGQAVKGILEPTP